MERGSTRNHVDGTRMERGSTGQGSRVFFKSSNATPTLSQRYWQPLVLRDLGWPTGMGGNVGILASKVDPNMGVLRIQL